jgi:hypothetical protein
MSFVPKYDYCYGTIKLSLTFLGVCTDLFLSLDEFNTFVKFLAAVCSNFTPTVITPACMASQK